MPAPDGAPDLPPQAPPRRHGRFRRFVVRPFFWLLALAALLVLGLVLLLQSDFLRRRAQALLIAQLREVTGRAATAGEVKLSLMPLSVEVNDLMIPGEGPGDPPLAAIGRLRIAGEWEGLRSRVLRLSEVVVERPEFDLRIAPDGSLNLPQFPRGAGSRRQLEVRVDALLVHAGHFHFDDRAIPLELEAKGIHARLVRARRGDLRGDAIVERVDLTLPNARPLPVAVSGSVVLGAGGIEIENGRVRADGLVATASGPISWGRPGGGELRFAGEGSTSVLERLGYLHGEVTADAWQAEGRVWWGTPPASLRGTAAAPGPRFWGVDGRARAPRAVLLGRRVEDLDATAAVDETGVHVSLTHARYHGGETSGGLEIGFDAGHPTALRVHVDGAEAAPLLGEQGVPFTGIAGRVTGDFDYRFTFTEAERGSGGGRARITAGPAEPGRIAVGGDAVLAIERGVLTLQALDLASATQRLQGSGHVDFAGGAGAFDFAAETSDAGELAPLVPVAPGQLWLPTAGRGTLGAHLDLPGGGEPPVTRARFGLRDVVAPGLAAEEAHGELTLTGRAVEGLRLEAARGDRLLTVAGRVPIAEPTPRDAAEIALEIGARRWPAAQARPWLPKDVAAVPLDGEWTGRVVLRGPLAALGGEVEGDLDRVTLAGLPLDHVHAKLGFDAELLRVRSLVATLAAGDVRGEGTLRFADQALDFTVAAPALRLAAPPLDAVLGHLEGNAEVRATVGGTFARPAVRARVVGHDLGVLGRELGNRGTSELALEWQGDRLTASGSVLGLLDVDGGGALTRDAAELRFAVRGETLPRIVEAAIGLPEPDLQAGFAGSLVVRGGTVAPWTAELELADLHAGLAGLALANREPVRLRYADGRLRIESFWLGEVGADAEAVLAGSVGLGADQRLDLKFQSSLPGRWVTALLPAVQVSGALDMLATVRGTFAQPAWNGQGVLQGARVIFLGFPHALEDVNVSLTLEPARLVIDGLQAKLGGGQVSGGGAVDLPGGPAPGDYRFQLLARQVQIRYPEGFVLRGDAELALAPAEGGRVIRGVVDLDRVFYLTDLKLGPAQLLRRLLQKQRLEIAETDEFLASTQLNVAVRAPGAVRVRNNVANLHGGADLALRGSLATPVVFGRVEIDAGGTVRYGDNDYEIDRAVVNFSNPYRIEPVFDIVARTTVDAYKVKLSLSGTLDRMKPVFSSDPPIPENEVLGLLATGQAASPNATTENDLSQGVGAEAFLYGQAASLVGQRVGNLFGLDSFRVEPLTGASSTLSSVRVTVGKRLRRDLYVTYSVDPSGTQEQIFKVEWQVRPELALILTQNGDGSYALDARWEKSY